MTKMKILHISTAKTWRGGEQQLAYLLEELRDQCENHVICTEGSEMEAHCIAKGYTYSTSKKRFSLDPTFAKHIKQYCSANGIQLIHTHDSHAHSLSILAIKLFGNTVPLIVSRRVDFPIEKSWFSHYKYNHPLVKKILCVSEEIKRITAMSIKNQSVLETVYSGIDLKKFSPRSNRLRKELQIADDVFLIGNTSALADHKDYFTFVDAAEIALQKDPSLLFLIIGKGPKEDEISSYIRVKDLESYIQMIGFRTDVPEILADLDLFMITSKTEGLGTSILDAFATQVPVLATEAGGIPELVEDGKTGILCEIGDKSGLAEKISALKSDAALRQRLVEGATEKVKLFSKSQTAKQSLAVYSSVLK